MRRGLFIVAGMLATSPALACTVVEPFDMKRIAGAELVVVGEVTDYRDLGSSWGTALVTVAVEATLKGRADGVVTFVWNGGLAQGPDAALAQGRVLIGAKRGGRLALSDRVPDARPDLPSIIQPYCGEVWMQSATPATVQAAREALE